MPSAATLSDPREAGSVSRPLRVLVFGRYMREQNRTHVLREALRSNGVDLVDIYPEKLRSIPVSFFRALSEPFDVIYIPFGGAPFVFPAKLLSLLRRKPMVFDLLISALDSEVEYGMVKEGSLRYWRLYLQERLACSLPDFVLTESEPQMRFLSGFLRIPLRRFRVVPVGALAPTPSGARPERGVTTVLFYGIVRKATGFDHIARAAALLQDRQDIRFRFYGRNRYYEWVREEWNGKLLNAEFHPAMPPAEVGAAIDRSDICLGVFGDHPKASRALGNRAFECMARGKAFITRTTLAGEPFFRHGENIWFVPPASPPALAEAIAHLADHPEERERIGAAGREVYERHFTPRQVGRVLLDVFAERAPDSLPGVAKIRHR